ncbi:MAG TPA: hypothetical protein VFD89_02090 [Clostridia bacterium]|nr:hypothetical protein [Clostridia bacterium]
MNNRGIILVCILMIVLTIIPMGILAEGEEDQSQREDIIIEAKIGFDNHYRVGSWTPIVIEIENLGQDIHGDLEVLVNQDQGTAITYSRAAVIAKNSKKRFMLYAQINTTQRKFKIDLKQKNKTLKSLELKSLKPMTLNKYLMGVITDDKPALGYWWRTLGGDSVFANHETVLINKDEIPHRPEVMENFAMIVINNADTAVFTQEQQQVLGQWVNNGGILIIGTGSNASKTLSGLKPTIVDGQIGNTIKSEPIEGIGNMSLDLAGLSLQDSKTLMEDGGQAIIWGLNSGRGNIFIAGFDLGLEPFTSWEGNKTFWERVLTNNLKPSVIATLKGPDLSSSGYQPYGYGYNYGIREALSSIKALDLPPFTNLLIILLGYLLVVGPINYIILKKLDKREWMWFTIPGFVILFSIGIYGIGYSQKGSEVIINTISTISARENTATIDTYVGVFIPKRGDYNISIDGDVLMTPYGEGDMGYAYGSSFPSSHGGIIKAKVSQGNPSSITLYDSNVWTMRTLMYRGFKENLGDIKGDLYYKDGKVKGTIINNTSFLIEDSAIYTLAGDFEKIGNLIPGVEVEVNLSVSSPSTQSGYGHNDLYMMIDSLFPYPNSGSRQPSDEERSRWAKRNFVEGLIMKYDGNDLLHNDFINLLGFCDYDLEEKITVVGSGPVTPQNTGVVLSGFDIVYERDGQVGIPPGYVKGILKKELSDMIHSDDSIFYLDRGKGVFEFDMTPYMDLELTKIEVVARPYGDPIGLSPLDAGEGDYMDEDDSITYHKARGAIIISPDSISRFIDDEGKMLIKIEGRPREYISFEAPTLIIEGRKR